MATENVKLDKERPYGIVMGDPKVGFEQGGMHFSHDGKPLERWASADQLLNEQVLREKQLAKEKALAARRDRAEMRRKLLEDD